MRGAAGIRGERRENFRSSADGARVEEQGKDVAGEWVDICGKALLGPENLRVMREAEEKERKTKVSEVAKRVERKEKSNGAPACPRIRDKQQREEGKQRTLSKEKAAATRLEIPVDGERSSARVPTVLASRSRARM